MMEEHPADKLPIDKIEMLSEPLFDEHGDINPFCIGELSEAIENMPETHERLKDNKEWSLSCWTTDIEILGSLSLCAVRCFGGCPPNLFDVIEYVKACLRKSVFTGSFDDDRFRMTKLSLCEINKFLWDCLGDFQQFTDWNNQKYKHWIDLSACLHNVCVAIRNHRRHDFAFDYKFDKPKQPNGDNK